MSTLRQTVVGRYELLRELGRGGMATVYLARQIDLERHVALKELGAFRMSEPSFARRFLREARLAGSLSHPNVVTVYDYFEADGAPYIAMEYVERGTLRPYVGRMSLAQIGGVLEAVLAALSVAEETRIVHRDLKPENLLVTADGRVKVSDFGIAKATNDFRPGPTLTATGVAVGTPNYMAPEQATAKGVGPWTDLYSVGMMAFEFLIGRPPFGDTDNAIGVLLRQVNEAVPAVSEMDPRIDSRLSEWIAWLVAKEPAERPASAAMAWDEIEETFLALLGPRWRRQARLPARSDAPPPPSVLYEEPARVPLASRRQAATTLPPRTPEPAAPMVASSASSRTHWGRRAATFALAAAALVAVAVSLAGRMSGHPTSAATPPVPAPAPAASVVSPTTAKPQMGAEQKSAHRLVRVYDSAAARVARLASARRAGSPASRLVTALRQTSSAYRAAESAARSGDAAGYATAIQAAEASKSSVNTAVAELRASNSPNAPTQVQRTQCSGDSVSDDPSDDDC
jgi:serine/threonine protein kinase